MDAVFGILGPTALRVDGEWDAGWGPPRERAILAALLVNAGKPMPLDTLVEWVQEDETALRNPAATFHTYSTRIRKSLERQGIDAPLVVQDRTFRLGIDPLLVDLHLFRKLMADVRELRRQARTADALDLARQAISLGRGRPIDDLHTDRARAWRHRVVVNDWLPANTMLFEILLELGEHTTVLSQVDGLLDEHPDDLGLAKVRMAALHGTGRTHEATDYYFNVRSRLLRDDSDFQAADHIRQFHESLQDSRPAPERDPADEKTPVPRLLPRDIEFVGRDELLRALNSAAPTPSGESTGRVVILDGMAGVGKTALAVHWGHLARRRHFPDGDFFFDLQGYSDGALVSRSRVVEDMLLALGSRPDDGLDQRARELLLSGLLAGKRALVVLDNARDTAHVKDLIALMPSCVVVVTSRDRLSLLSATTGARRVGVGPMPAREAAELLSVRLGPHRQQLEPDDRARVVRLCGGLPLVITLLAEHIAVSGMARLSAFVEGLDRRKLLLGDDVAGSALAHTALAWSYELLAPAEQRLFRLLGLHPGPEIGIDMACACDGRTRQETRQSFGALVSAHLLERLDPFGDRHRFHDFFREFAGYRAELDESPEDRQAAERRVLSFYLQSAGSANHVLYPYRATLTEIPAEDGVEPMTFRSTVDAKLWFDQERANLIAAVRFANSRGHHAHATRIADYLTTYLDRHGFYDDSRTVRELAVASAHAAADRDSETSSLEGLAMVHLILGDHAEARRCVNNALRLAMADQNEQAQAACLHLLGRLAEQRGDPSAAVDLYKRCIDVAGGIDDLVGQCWSHCRLGEPLRLLDQHDDALLHLFRARELAERVDVPSALASSLATIASVYRDKGDPHAATAHATRALAVAEAIPDLAITVQVCTTLAEIAIESDDSADAIRHARHAVDVCLATHNLSAEARSREVLGNVLLAAGDTAGAAPAWRRAATIYDRTGNTARAVLLRTRIDKLPTGDLDLPEARAASPSPDLATDHNNIADRPR